LFIYFRNCKTYDEDEFYNNIGNIHGEYLPILKPYKVNMPGDFTYINFEDVGQVNTILAIDVQDSLIYVKSDNTNLMDEKYHKYFLVEYYYGNELSFYTEDELLEYVNKKGYKKPIWRDINQLWNQVNSDDYPWNIKLDSMYQKRQIKKTP
jgi:hypothetical protein